MYLQGQIHNDPTFSSLPYAPQIEKQCGTEDKILLLIEEHRDKACSSTNELENKMPFTIVTKMITYLGINKKMHIACIE